MLLVNEPIFVMFASFVIAAGSFVAKWMQCVNHSVLQLWNQ